MLRACGPKQAALLPLRNALADRVNVVIAKAASITADLELQDLIPDILSAFDRLFDQAAKADPKCWGKEALAKALIKLGQSDSAPFLRGLRHIQMEPVWGREVDTAAALRSVCALALLQCTDLTREEKLWHEMRALTDLEPGVRADAARALQELEGRDAAFLLRLKARMGDKEPAVIGQVLESLLHVEGDDAICFVAEFLSAKEEELREEAALALGASRLPAALALLIQTWTRSGNSQSGESLLRALGASRHDSAIAFLTELIRFGEEREALAALAALEPQRDSAEIRNKIAVAVGERPERSVGEYFRERFPPLHLIDI